MILLGNYNYLEYYQLVTSILKHWPQCFRNNNTETKHFTTLFDFVKRNVDISRFMYKWLFVKMIDVDCQYDFIKLWASEIDVAQDPRVQEV